jgi:hypothetical protein
MSAQPRRVRSARTRALAARKLGMRGVNHRDFARGDCAVISGAVARVTIERSRAHGEDPVVPALVRTVPGLGQALGLVYEISSASRGCGIS